MFGKFQIAASFAVIYVYAGELVIYRDYLFLSNNSYRKSQVRVIETQNYLT
jgi:hypothetical protein